VRAFGAAFLAVAGVLGSAGPLRAQVSGSVIDLALAPVPGARVAIQAVGPSTVTDANGAFALPAVSGSGLVVVAG
jgi:hypothetical protein